MVGVCEAYFKRQGFCFGSSEVVKTKEGSFVVLCQPTGSLNWKSLAALSWWLSSSLYKVLHQRSVDTLLLATFSSSHFSQVSIVASIPQASMSFFWSNHSLSSTSSSCFSSYHQYIYVVFISCVWCFYCNCTSSRWTKRDRKCLLLVYMGWSSIPHCQPSTHNGIPYVCRRRSL